MSEKATAYPLQWPSGWPRSKVRQHAAFKTDRSTAISGLYHELELLGAKQVILSTDLEPRLDGQPKARQGTTLDAGAAVYFQLEKRPMVFACDQYHALKDNIQALRKTIEAMRGIKRWGASELLERAFTGFVQIEHAPGSDWRTVLGVERDANMADVESRFKRLASIHHPDKGGDVQAFQRLTAARDMAHAELSAQQR